MAHPEDAAYFQLHSNIPLFYHGRFLTAHVLKITFCGGMSEQEDTRHQPSLEKSLAHPEDAAYFKLPVDNFGTMLGENPTPYGILAL